MKLYRCQGCKSTGANSGKEVQYPLPTGSRWTTVHGALLEQVLGVNTSRRPSIDELKAHRFCSSIDWKSVAARAQPAPPTHPASPPLFLPRPRSYAFLSARHSAACLPPIRCHTSPLPRHVFGNCAVSRRAWSRALRKGHDSRRCSAGR